MKNYGCYPQFARFAISAAIGVADDRIGLDQLHVGDLIRLQGRIHGAGGDRDHHDRLDSMERLHPVQLDPD